VQQIRVVGGGHGVQTPERLILFAAPALPHAGIAFRRRCGVSPNHRPLESVRRKRPWLK
jgi:hypothetical protein